MSNPPPDIIAKAQSKANRKSGLKSARKAMRGQDGGVAKFPKERFLKFIDKLLIQSKDAGLVKFDMLESQHYAMEEIIKGIDDGVTTFLFLKARQLGISTFFLALDLFWAFEYPGMGGIFATHDEGSRDQFRNQIDVFLSGLPSSHKVGARASNVRMLILENLSTFRYLVAGTRASTNKMGRSGGCNYCHATEVAFWGSEDDLNALRQTFSETNKHRLYIFESTANGFNHFEEMWRTAETSPAMRAVFIGWWRDERNEYGVRHPLYPKYMPEGINTPLTRREKEGIKAVKEKYGFDITAGQLAWYRCHLETKCGDDMNAMNQEHPWVPEDAFISTGSTFFATDTLTTISKEAARHRCKPFMFKISDNFIDTQLHAVTTNRGAELKIWEGPVEGAQYVIGADPIFGSSDNRDNGVITIGRAYADRIVQVAEYVSQSISAYQYAWIIAYLAGLYKDVMLNLEITGPGAVVYQELKQLKQKLAQITPGEDDSFKNCLRYMRDFLYVKADSLSGNSLLQWKSSPELRKQLMFKFRDGVTAGRLHVRSMHLVDEMRYLNIDAGYVEAPPSKRDDRVFGAALMYWAWDNKLRGRLERRPGMTFIECEERRLKGDPDQIVQMVRRTLSGSGIDLPS